MSDNKAVMRRSPRLEVNVELNGHIKSTVPVKVLDISEHGMRIESPIGMPPAGMCEVNVEAPDGTLVIDARVARCRLKMVKQDDGSITRVFHAGLEFPEEYCGCKEVKALMDQVCKLEDEEQDEITTSPITEGKIVKAM